MEHPTIGLAAEFYRVRLSRLDETGDVDLDWREDILYRAAPPASDSGAVTWRIEAVGLDDPDSTWCLLETARRDDAIAFLEEARRDLGEITRSQFEKRYFASS
jgi:hypothetical protein